MRSTLRVDEKTQTQNATGEMVDSWSVFEQEVPAEIAYMSGREFVSGGGVIAGADCRITVRDLPGLNSTMRFVDENDRDKVYSILAVLPDKTLRRHMTCVCSSGVNRG